MRRVEARGGGYKREIKGEREGGEEENRAEVMGKGRRPESEVGGGRGEWWS